MNNLEISRIMHRTHRPQQQETARIVHRRDVVKAKRLVRLLSGVAGKLMQELSDHPDPQYWPIDENNEHPGTEYDVGLSVSNRVVEMQVLLDRMDQQLSV